MRIIYHLAIDGFEKHVQSNPALATLRQNNNKYHTS